MTAFRLVAPRAERRALAPSFPALRPLPSLSVHKRAVDNHYISAVIKSEELPHAQESRNDRLAAPVEAVAAVGAFERVDDVEQVGGGGGGGEELAGGDVALERLAQLRVDGAGVQTDDDPARAGAGEFDRGGPHEHIERRLRRAVAVPAAELVVADAADARRENREDAAAVRRQERKEMLGDDRGTDGVDGEGAGEPGRIEVGQRLFGAFRVVVEKAGRDDDEVGTRGEPAGRGGDAVLVRDADMVGAGAGARQGADLVVRVFVAQGLDERRADAAGRADDDRRAGQRTNRIVSPSVETCA